MRPALPHYEDGDTSQYNWKENIKISRKGDIFNILLEKHCDPFERPIIGSLFK